MKKPIIFSFFSGSGFLDLGFEDNGFDVQFVNENHQPFLDAYVFSRSKLKKSKPRFGYSSKSIDDLVYNGSSKDLSSYVNEAKSTRALVGFIGGPPCPDFSVGGKNKGKDGENGKLTKVYVDAISKFKPDFFIFENVKGLWRTKRHREFYDKMKSELDSAGYLLTDRLTNCIEYGAPQDRDRILLFGILRNKSVSGDKNLEKDFNWDKELKYERSQILDKNIWPATDSYSEDSKLNINFDGEIYKSLTVQYWFDKNEVNDHPNAKHHFIPRAGLPKFQIIDEGDDSKKSYKRLHRWRYSPTAAYGNNEVHLHPYKSRRISAAEALSIQSLPKEFELPHDMSLTNMFKTIGNGVPYLAGSGLAKTVKRYLELKTKPEFH